MRFALLGPVQVGDGGECREIRGLMQRTVLAVLLLQANEVVSVDRLSEVLWGGQPHPTAAALHNHVTRLRRVMGGGNGSRIRAVPPGYLIKVGPGELDLDVFAELCGAGRRAAAEGRWDQASRDLGAALAQWRGQPLADVPGLDGHARIGQLVEARIQALEGRVEAELNLGRHPEVISELRALTADHPLREVFHEQLMLALYRAGRQAEALHVFRGLRDKLVDELGVEPSASAQKLYRQILNAEEWLARPVRDRAVHEGAGLSRSVDAGSGSGNGADGDAAGPGRAGLRRQLPPGVRVFIGRDRELDRLVELAREASAATRPGTLVISAIDGMAGIGKTALAVHAAHHLAGSFPDGQLFLDLHGYTEGLPPREPAEALAAVLQACGFSARQIPADLDARAALYRDRLAGTRTLILLDNAASEAQVRPLLPSAPGCLVLITSRKRLKGLDDARSMSLGLLPPNDAVVLFREVAGLDCGPVADPLLDEIAALCGLLPLALRVAAALIRHRPAWTLRRLADKLADQRAALGQFSDGDRSLPAVFDLSYAVLHDGQRLLFRRFGLVPGPDADVYAAAALIEAGYSDTERLLQELVDHNLLTEPVQGRYRLHDLVRVYARSRAGRDDSAQDREQALDRLLDYYQDTAHRADRYLARPKPAGIPPVANPPRVRPALDTREQADAWLSAELPGLIAAAEESAVRARPVHAVWLPAALHEHLRSHGAWSRALELHSVAAATAQAIGDLPGRAAALTNVGIVCWVSGDYAGARGVLGQALDLYRALREPAGQALVHNNIGTVCMSTGDYPGSVRSHERALELYRGLGDLRGQASVLNNLGLVRCNCGDYSGAVQAHKRALELFRGLGDLSGEARNLNNLAIVLGEIGDIAGAGDALSRALDLFQTMGGDLYEQTHALNNLGSVWSLLGDHAGAARAHEQALDQFRKIGDRQGQGQALGGLGAMRRATGDHQGAIDAWEQAANLFQEIGDRRAEGEVLNGCGQASTAIGELEPARARHSRALRLAREVASPMLEADALAGLGEISLREGGLATGIEQLRDALAIYRTLGVPAAERVEARLAEYAGPDAHRPRDPQTTDIPGSSMGEAGRRPPAPGPIADAD